MEKYCRSCAQKNFYDYFCEEEARLPVLQLEADTIHGIYYKEELKYPASWFFVENRSMSARQESFWIGFWLKVNLLAPQLPLVVIKGKQEVTI